MVWALIRDLSSLPKASNLEFGPSKKKIYFSIRQTRSWCERAICFGPKIDHCFRTLELNEAQALTVWDCSPNIEID